MASAGTSSNSVRLRWSCTTSAGLVVSERTRDENGPNNLERCSHSRGQMLLGFESRVWDG